MAMLDYKVFQQCGVLVSLIKTYFISIFSKWDRVAGRQFWQRFPNCVLDHVIPKFSSDVSDPPPSFLLLPNSAFIYFLLGLDLPQF